MSASRRVLLDVHLPGGGGRAVLGGVVPIIQRCSSCLSVSDAPEDVIAVIRRARGYITKTIEGANCWMRFTEWAPATPCSRPAWLGSSLTHSPSPPAPARPRPGPAEEDWEG